MYRRIVSFLEYLLMLLVIIEFNTPYTYFLLVNRIVHFLPLAILFLLILLRIKKIKLSVVVLFLLFGAFLPSLNVAEGHLFEYVRLYVLLLPMFFIYLAALLRNNGDGIKSLFFKYSNIVIILAIMSLFFWTFGSMLEKISYTAIIPNSWGGEHFIPTYYGLHFETQEAMATEEQSEALVRNSGIFNEAPMYNMILCVALAIECFLRDKMSVTRIVILVSTILTTISTTGFIFLAILAVVKFYSLINKKHRSLLILCSPFLLIMAYLAISSILANKKETGGSSYDSRSADIQKCIEVGLENPILGVELFHEADEQSFSKKKNYGYSNSLFTIFAHGGFYTLALYLFTLIIAPLIYYGKARDGRFLALMICFFLLFTFTSAKYKYLTILFMAVGLSYWDIYVYRRNERAKSIH